MAPEPEDTWADDVDEMVDRLGRLPEPGTEPGTTTIGAASAPERDGNFLCVEQEISETAQYAEYVATQANSNALWVGALIQGQALSNGMFTEVALPRAPMRISVGAENLTGQASAELEAPSLSAYRDAVRGILSNGLQGSQAAQVNYSTETIHSEEHMALSMGADVNAGNVDVMASFDFTRDDIRSRVVVNFTQAYYTVDMDAVAGAHAFFEPGTDISDIANAFGGADATAPLYVSSITYGRRVVFTAESTANAQELKAALDFAYDGLANNVSVEARMSHAEVLESSTIRAFILGGNPDDAVQAVQGIEGIQAFIRDGGTFSADSPGAPIGYKLNHLSDNSTARLSLTTDYTKEVCERVGQNIKVTLLGITPVNGQNNPMTYGTIYTRSFNDSGDEARRHTLFSKSLDERVQMRDGERWSESNTGRSAPCPASRASPKMLWAR